MLTSAIDEYLARKLMSFHSPVHGGDDGLHARDLSELTGLDDLQYPSDCIAETQKFIAGVFGAANSYMLVNGASVGMQAALLALRIQYGSDKPVLIARNVHKSVIAGLVISGLDVEWFEPEWITELGCYGRFNLSSEAISYDTSPSERSLLNVNEHREGEYNNADGTLRVGSKYCGIVVTNPTYEGFHSELPRLDIPVIVDEAHGAHYIFSDQLPASALESGADIVVQSWHKTLGSLTQTGVLHISKRIDPEIMAEALRLLQTTSPSYLLMESIAKTAQLMATDGKNIFARLLDLRPGINFPTHPNNDPLRINFSIAGLSGEELFDLFEEENIALEKYSSNSVLGLINLNTSASNIERLNQAYAEVSSKNHAKHNLHSQAPTWSEQLINTREAFLAGAKIYAPCPPGIATQLPGQLAKQLDSSEIH